MKLISKDSLSHVWKFHVRLTAFLKPHDVLFEFCTTCLGVATCFSRFQDDFPGLIPLIRQYLLMVEADINTICTIHQYLTLIEDRATGNLVHFAECFCADIIFVRFAFKVSRHSIFSLFYLLGSWYEEAGFESCPVFRIRGKSRFVIVASVP